MAKPAGVEPELDEQKDLPAANILVVDDAFDSLTVLSQMLSYRGYKVRTAESGLQALEAAQAQPPDLILLDVMMPEMDGYEVCRRLKAADETRHIPVIFLSAMNTSEDKLRAFEAGGADYITKPFHLQEVLARVKMHLAVHLLQTRLQEQNTQLEQEIARREQIEQTLRHSTERLQLLREIYQAILGARSLEAIARAALRRMPRLVPSCQRVSVVEFEVDAAPKALAVEAAQGFSVDVGAWLDLLYDAASQQTHIQGVADMEALPARTPLQERLYAQGVRSYLFAPLLAQGKVIGTLSLETDRPNVFLPEHVETVAEVAAMLALAIQQVRLQASLRQQTVELEAQNAELDAFAHTVAHDLKNPLTVVASSTDLLAQYGDSFDADEQKKMAQTAAKAAHKAASIINDLLLLASAHKQAVQLRPLDMAGIVSEVQDRLNDMIKQYAAEITTPGAEAWPQALGYAPWVEEVWTNYLSNALKYGGAPGAPLRIELGAALDQASGQICFWVQDHGRGLTPEEQAHLFMPFERLGQAEVEGHGLGLSIVRRIVEKLGGRVGVDSAIGQGSRFYFTLPAAPPDASPAEQEQPPLQASQPTALQGLRVLLAEDSPMNQEMILRLLEQLGCQAEAVGSGAEALRALWHQRYDVALMDVHMPGVSGLEAARAIRREWPPERQPYIIAMTGACAPDELAAYAEAGMNECVGKPVRLQDLAAALGRCKLGKPASAAASRAAGGPAAEPQDADALLDWAVLEELTRCYGAARPDFVKNLVGMYLAESPRLLAALRQALEQGNAQELRYAAHTLKGNSRNLGVRRVGALCERLEALGHAGAVAGAETLLAELSRELEHAHAVLREVLASPRFGPPVSWQDDQVEVK